MEHQPFGGCQRHKAKPSVCWKSSPAARPKISNDEQRCRQRRDGDSKGDHREFMLAQFAEHSGLQSVPLDR